MNFLKLKSILFSLTAVVMFTVFLSSCEKDFVKEQLNENINDIKANKYSGEDYFRGIFLLENEIASKISSLEYYHETLEEELESQPDLKEEFSNDNDEIVKRINNRDSEYFNSLKLAIESKNVSQVEEAIDYGNILLYDATISNHYKEMKDLENVASKINIEDYDMSTDEGKKAYLADAETLILTNLENNSINESDYVEGRCWAVWGVYALAAFNYGAAINVAAAINYGAAINISVAVFATVWFWGKTAQDEQTDFERERFVTEILELNS